MPSAHEGSFTSQIHFSPPDGAHAMYQAHSQPPQDLRTAHGVGPVWQPLVAWPGSPQHLQRGSGFQPQYFTPNGMVWPGIGPPPSWGMHQQQAQLAGPLQHQQHICFRPAPMQPPQAVTPVKVSFGMPELEAHAPEAAAHFLPDRAEPSKRQRKPADSGDEDEADWEQDSPSKRKRAKQEKPASSHAQAGAKNVDSRSSKFKGVTKHRRSGR